MMKLILATLLAFSLVGCIPDYTGDTTTHVDNSTIDNSVSYGEGDVLICTDSECVLAEEHEDVGDAIVGVYDPEYTPTECNAAGFFYCTIENVCLDQPLDTGTCNP